MRVGRQLAAFLATGSCAAATHWGSVLLLVEAGGLAPLHANVAGFALAFLVSYGGHRRWTFAATGLAHRVALPRFLLVAVAGLGLNQSLFALLLAATPMSYPLALLLVLAAVATFTFLLSRHWAFLPPPR